MNDNTLLTPSDIAQLSRDAIAGRIPKHVVDEVMTLHITRKYKFRISENLYFEVSMEREAMTQNGVDVYGVTAPSQFSLSPRLWFGLDEDENAYRDVAFDIVDPRFGATKGKNFNAEEFFRATQIGQTPELSDWFTPFRSGGIVDIAESYLDHLLDNGDKLDGLDLDVYRIVTDLYEVYDGNGRMISYPLAFDFREARRLLNQVGRDVFAELLEQKQILASNCRNHEEVIELLEGRGERPRNPPRFSLRYTEEAFDLIVRPMLDDRPFAPVPDNFDHMKAVRGIIDLEINGISEDKDDHVLERGMDIQDQPEVTEERRLVLTAPEVQMKESAQIIDIRDPLTMPTDLETMSRSLRAM